MRQNKNAIARELGLSNKAYKKRFKKTFTMVKNARMNLKKLDTAYRLIANKIIAESNVKVNKVDSFFHYDGGLIIQCILDESREKATDIEDQFDIEMQNIGLNTFDLMEVITLQFISLEEYVEDDKFMKELGL